MMVSKRRTQPKAQAIVQGHLEQISSRVFEDYREQITQLIHNHQGVYALYRRKKLYYVGLATDLKRRINQHLKDRHKGKWTHFSLYIIRAEDHIRELETLLLRIADPAGNATKGRLKRSKNLLPVLKRNVRLRIQHDLAELFGEVCMQSKSKLKSRENAETKIKKDNKSHPLLGLLPRGTRLKAEYKGKSYAAHVRADGSIYFNGKRYDSPSGAGKALTGKAMNGWWFWQARNKEGQWRRLQQIREGGKVTKQKKQSSDRMLKASKSNNRCAQSDTIICPAKKDGFETTFVGENRWYAIRISPKRIPFIKYIAAYETKPISAITHYATIESIKPWRNTGKYVVNFKNPARRIKPILLGDSLPPQGPQFTNWKTLRKAKVLADCFID